jgi:hypothetical protein
MQSWDSVPMKRDDGSRKKSPAPSVLLKPGREESPARNRSLKTIQDIDASLEAIRNRIDEAYSHICLDLPEINMEIYRTFQQASDTLDSLIAGGSAGAISQVVECVDLTLQNIMVRMKHLRNHDSRFLETIRLTCLDTPLVRKAPGKDALLEQAVRFSDLRDELMAQLTRTLEEEDGLMNEISSRIGSDIKSLEITLSSTVEILKDLISRSNSMKEPIQKIMSGLQTHDIVNQDISTISLGLRKMYSLQDESGDEVAPPCSFYFQEKASSLSHGLISQLIDVIRHHGTDLDQEIRHIENLIFNVKEDKEAISDFLLMSLEGMSTFDIVIAEFLQMFACISSLMDSLCARKEGQLSLQAELLELFTRLDGNAPDGMSQNAQQGTPGLVHRMISPLKPKAMLLRRGNGLQELKEISWMLHRDADLMRHKLEEIKVMLIDSIRGIDTYSDRCLEAIGKFEGDIQKLMKTLDGSDMLLDNLNAITLSLAQIPGTVFEDSISSLPRDLGDILYRLENPHSSTLMTREAPDTDEGLTFF